MDDHDHAADLRWAAAAKLVQGAPDAGMPRRRARALTLIAVLYSATLAGGIVLGITLLQFQRGPDDDASTDLLQLAGQFVFLIIGLAVGVGGFIWARRNGYYITRWRFGTSPLNRQEKKTVMRQITGKQPVDDHLPVVIGIAGQTRRAAIGVAPIYAALVMFAISSALSTDQLVLQLLQAAVVALFAFVALQQILLYRRAGTFIEKHAEPVANGTA